MARSSCKRCKWPPKSFSGVKSLDGHRFSSFTPTAPPALLPRTPVWEGAQGLTTILFTNPERCLLWVFNWGCLYNLLPTPARSPSWKARKIWITVFSVRSWVSCVPLEVTKCECFQHQGGLTCERVLLIRCPEHCSRWTNNGQWRPRGAWRRAGTPELGPEGSMAVWQAEERGSHFRQNGTGKIGEQRTLFGKWWEGHCVHNQVAFIVFLAEAFGLSS